MDPITLSLISGAVAAIPSAIGLIKKPKQQLPEYDNSQTIIMLVLGLVVLMILTFFIVKYIGKNE